MKPLFFDNKNDIGLRDVSIKNNQDVRFAEGGMTYREYADSQFNEEEDLHLPSGYLSDFEIKKSDKKKFPILFKEKNGLEYRLKNDFDSSIRVFDGDKEIGYADNKAIMVAPTYQKKGIGLDLVSILKERNPNHRFGSMTPEGFALMGKYYDTKIANNPDTRFAEGGKVGSGYKYSKDFNGIIINTNEEQEYVGTMYSPFESKGSFKATVRKGDLVNIAIESESLKEFNFKWGEDDWLSIVKKLKLNGINELELFKVGNIIKTFELKLIKNTTDIRFADGGTLNKKWSSVGNMTKSEAKKFYESKEGKALDKETYNKWKSLVNMSKGELDKFYNSQEGKDAGLSPREANEKGIDSGRESARWIMKMKDTPYSEWTPTMWIWAKKQISFISRMSGNKGGLYDDKGNKTRKHTSLLIWGNNPEKYGDGGDIINNKIMGKQSFDKKYDMSEFEMSKSVLKRNMKRRGFYDGLESDLKRNPNDADAIDGLKTVELLKKKTTKYTLEELLRLTSLMTTSSQEMYIDSSDDFLPMVVANAQRAIDKQERVREEIKKLLKEDDSEYIESGDVHVKINEYYTATIRNTDSLKRILKDEKVDKSLLGIVSVNNNPPKEFVEKVQSIISNYKGEKYDKGGDIKSILDAKRAKIKLKKSKRKQ